MNALSLSICSKNIRIIDNLFCLNDLHKASGDAQKHKPANFLRSQQTIDLIELLKSEQLAPALSKQGLGTFVCIELVYAYAMWISPKFYLTVIRTIMEINQPKQLLLPELKNNAYPFFLTRQLANEFDARLRSLFDLAGLMAKRGDDVAMVFQKQAKELNKLLAWQDSHRA
ncbi:KilA-N domain-containing protein [Acinetobacter bereziniae]|uniref:KilA-N domain-containing protein n=1 Tax=Acinetobacter bereziniae TaxID=106648 RepID=UPI003AF8FFAB